MKHLASWTTRGDYGIAVLVKNQNMKTLLEEQIAKILKSEHGVPNSLSREARIIVEAVPSSRTISTWLRSA